MASVSIDHDASLGRIRVVFGPDRTLRVVSVDDTWFNEIGCLPFFWQETLVLFVLSAG